jgi:hypothetical protein
MQGIIAAIVERSEEGGVELIFLIEYKMTEQRKLRLP